MVIITYYSVFLKYINNNGNNDHTILILGIQNHIGRHTRTCTEVGVGGHIVWSRPGVLISFCPTGAQVYSCSFCKCANE